MRFLLLCFLFATILSGCSDYNKLLKNNDSQVKYDAAVAFFNEGECYKALPIFEQLLGLTRGDKLAEGTYIHYAKTHYCIGDYYLANYYFGFFVKTFPTSKYAEEATFLAAMCSFKNSPVASLDQRDTKVAIDEFQLFLDRYPNSELRDSTENIISGLNEKLELKAKEIAKLYVKTERYNAASKALENFLVEYPNTADREEIMFLIVESSYFYAELSRDTKKKERYSDTVDSYYNFVSAFPQSEYLRRAESYFIKSRDAMENL